LSWLLVLGCYRFSLIEQIYADIPEIKNFILSAILLSSQNCKLKSLAWKRNELAESRYLNRKKEKSFQYS
jgi:hypothetical protein